MGQGVWELLGLTGDDQKVYQFHLAHPQATVPEVAKGVRLAARTVSDSQQRLVDCGLLRRDSHGAVHPDPAGPDLVAAQLRADLDAHQAQRRQQIIQLQREMARSLQHHMLTAPSAGPRIERLPSLANAGMRAEELLSHARSEIVRSQPEITRLPFTAPPGAAPAEVRALRRGIPVRVIYPPADLAIGTGRRTVDGELRAGLAIRVAKVPATHLIVVDRATALVVDDSREDEPRILLIQEGALVHSLHELFETLWRYAADAMAFLRDTGDDELPADERLLLQLLAQGMKDEAVAKRLGVSVRTVRRKISDVQQRLQTDSRFQAGVLAARRRWV